MIETEDYVRINGIIGRVEQIGNSLFWIEDGSSYSLSDKSIKHSKNIIDLIEVGDIVEIELSEEFVEKENKKVLTQIGEVYTKETLQKDIDNGIITKILTILTKEQMEANCYTVERKE